MFNKHSLRHLKLTKNVSVKYTADMIYFCRTKEELLTLVMDLQEKADKRFAAFYQYVPVSYLSFFKKIAKNV